jgi:hypothetical protein
MHTTLTLKTNRILIFCWLVGVVVLAFTTSGAVLTTCAVGAAFGVCAGLLESRAVRSAPGRFAATVTMLDVRRVMMAASGGKLAIRVGWICAFVLFLVSLATGPPDQAPLLKWWAGYLTFMLVRDLIAYPALHVVASAAARTAEAMQQRQQQRWPHDPT